MEMQWEAGKNVSWGGVGGGAGAGAGACEKVQYLVKGSQAFVLKNLSYLCSQIP